MKKITPRVLRYNQAVEYLGMSRAVFDSLVRPAVWEFPVGQRGVGFDREELDAWLDHHKQTAGKPPSGQESVCGNQKNSAACISMKTAALGYSTSALEESEFTDALARVARQRQSRK